jgi:hypothetical protein
MSTGQYHLVVLLHSTAKAEGGQEDCMPPLGLMALQATVAMQQWEEGEPLQCYLEVTGVVMGGASLNLIGWESEQLQGSLTPSAY